jgi:glycolate oxidase iron-sulfur subunit
VSATPSYGAFDAFHPPSARRLADCVHCGFCLPACPTYQLWGQEMDSPRGRIWLMGAGLAGDTVMTETYVTHFDACLGCMACVTACPSGVRYDELIEATRSQIERNYPRSRSERLFRAFVFWVFPHRSRLRGAALLGWLYRRLRVDRLLRVLGVWPLLPHRLRALEELMPALPLRALFRTMPPERVAAKGVPRLHVGLVAGCVQSVFFAEVNAATVRVLAAEGCDVMTPRGQPCCGALMLHAGRETEALDHARRLIARFEPLNLDRVVVNAAGCGSTLKEYGRLLADDPDWAERAERFSATVRDVTEVVDELGVTAPRHPVAARVAYHDACHLRHAQGIRTPPRAILAAIPRLQLVEIPETDLCCGSAGIYNLLEPETAAELGARKAANIAATAPDILATANPGCALQIRRYLDPDVRALHPIQLTDASIRGVQP